MPNLSTHINFINCLIKKGFQGFDKNYLTLGTLAPDYYELFNDNKKSFLLHFKKEDEYLSNLESFKHYFSNKKLSFEEMSYYFGYYTHLWLENYYISEYDNLLLNANSLNLSHLALNRYIKENIKIYDLDSIQDFISDINLNIGITDLFSTEMPLSPQKAFHILTDFKYKVDHRPFNPRCFIVLDNKYYKDFLNNALDDFFSEHQYFETIFK